MCDSEKLEIIDNLIAGPVVDTTLKRNTWSTVFPMIEQLINAGIPIGRTMGSVYITDGMGECFFRSYPVYTVGDAGRLLLKLEREKLLCEI